MCPSRSELANPAVCADPLRYGVDDDGIPIDAEARCLLNTGARRTLARALKPLLRSKPWELVYDSACDGMCLEALYARAGAARRNQPQLLVCRDDLGHVAGAFLDEPVRNVLDRAAYKQHSYTTYLPPRLAVTSAQANALSLLLLGQVAQGCLPLTS